MIFYLTNLAGVNTPAMEAAKLSIRTTSEEGLAITIDDGVEYSDIEGVIIYDKGEDDEQGAQ